MMRPTNPSKRRPLTRPIRFYGHGKVTFSIDERTASRLNEAAERLAIPKSQVVPEAIQEYAERVGRLSEAEELRLLTIFDEMLPGIPERHVVEVENEIDEIRRARRSGGRSRTRT